MKASLCIVATGAGPIIPTSDNPYFTLYVSYMIDVDLVEPCLTKAYQKYYNDWNSHLSSLVNQTLPFAALDVLHHQHAEVMQYIQRCEWEGLVHETTMNSHLSDLTPDR